MKWISSLFFILYGNNPQRPPPNVSETNNPPFRLKMQIPVEKYISPNKNFVHSPTATHVVYAQDVEKVEVGIVQQFFEKRCYKHSTSGDAYDKLVVLSDDFRKYAQYTSTFLPDHLDHFCKNEKKILLLKMKDVNKQMMVCLPKEEKFLPQYVQDTATSFLQFLCQNDGSNVKSFFSTQGKQCRSTLAYNNASQEVGSCFSRVFKTVKDNEYMTKSNLCSDVGLVKGCFSAVLDKYCQGFAAFQVLNKEFFNYINSPCSACIFGINNLVIYLSVAVTLLYSKVA